MVGSAAILGVLSPLSAIAPDQWNRVFEIDVTAKWRLNRTLDPLLRYAGRALCDVERGALGPRLLGALLRLKDRA